VVVKAYLGKLLIYPFVCHFCLAEKLLYLYGLLLTLLELAFRIGQLMFNHL
jgi:hypothetical protein